MGNCMELSSKKYIVKTPSKNTKYWWFFATPLKNMSSWKSVGIMIFPIWWESHGKFHGSSHHQSEIHRNPQNFRKTNCTDPHRGAKRPSAGNSRPPASHAPVHDGIYSESTRLSFRFWRKGGHKVTTVVGCVMLWLENATRKSYQPPGEFQPCWPSKTISMLVDRYEKGQGAGSCSWPSVEVPWRPQGPSGNMLFAGRGMSKNRQGTHSASSILMVSRRSSAVASSAAFNWRSRELASLRWVNLNLGNLEGQFLVHGRLKKWGSPMF